MAIKLNRQDVLRHIKNFILVILGTAVLAFGTAVFLVQFDLVTGGVSGIGIILDNLIFNVDFSIGFLGIDSNIDFYIFALTWILFFIGLIFLGVDFALKTLVSTIFYPFFFGIFYGFVNPNFMNGIFYLQNSDYQDVAVIIAAVCGGACVGVGCAITFIAGGSTGGVDVLAFIICKLFKKFKSSTVIFIIDATVVILGVFVIEDLVLSTLGIISAFICAAVIDRVFLGGGGEAYVAQIVSNFSDEISDAVIEKMDRTTTVVDAMGGYSKLPKKVIIVSFNIHEYPDLIKIINSIDPGAFLTISRAHEINGEGWTQEKT